MAAAPGSTTNLVAVKEAEEKLSLFEACKNGDLEKVASLLTPESVNSRDVAGRKSTPLHFAAGKASYAIYLTVVCHATEWAGVT